MVLRIHIVHRTINCVNGVKQWKRISMRYKALRILGIKEELAWRCVNMLKAC